jgi:hypothetical protein
MNVDPTAPGHPPRAVVIRASLGLLAVITIAPLLLEPRPVEFLPAYSSRIATLASMATVLLLMAVAVTVRAELDQPEEPRAAGKMAFFALIAGLMTLVHWLEVDRHPVPAAWQRDVYQGILNHTFEAPHNYRPLPYGFARLVERITHDWTFACVSYRWFFTFWFVWVSYRLARLFLEPWRALLTLVPLVALYPLSVVYYWGQLTDPLSHTLFVLAFVYLLEDRPIALAAALALGVLAKETAVIVAPAYLACYGRRGWRAWLISAALGSACVAAFLAARLPLGWRPGYGNINGTTGLMIGTNLGFGAPIASTNVPLIQNYLHPLLFVGIFLPFLAWRWAEIDARLRALALTVVPLLLFSNVCFGWMYESRNYMPLVPLLATMALCTNRKRAQSDPGECHRMGT